MPLALTCAAILRVRNGYQVMNEVNGPDIGPTDPVSESWVIESGMADVEIKPAITCALPFCAMAQCA